MTMLFHTPSHLGDSSEGRRGSGLIWAVVIAAIVIAVAQLFVSN